jgi:drug/metabolite transporter (DMT)-like permease
MAGAPTASRSRILAASFAIYVFWGSAYLAMRFGMETIPPLLLAAVRLLLAGTLMGGFALAHGWTADWRRFPRAIVAGMLLFLGGHGFLYWGQARLNSGLAAVLYATVPLWIVVLEAAPPARIRPGWRSIVGLVLGTGGVMMLVGPASLLGAGRANVAGALAVAAASFCWAVGTLYCARARLPQSRALAGGIEMFSGGLLLLAVAWASGETRGFAWHRVAPASFAAIAFLVLCSSMIAFSCYLWLLKVAPPARVATYCYINPLVAVGLGWAVAAEAITIRTIAAMALLLSAVALIVSHPSATTPAGRRADDVETLEAQAAAGP